MLRIQTTSLSWMVSLETWYNLYSLLTFMVPPLVPVFTTLTCTINYCGIKESKSFYHWLRVNSTESCRFKDPHHYLPTDFIYFFSLRCLLLSLRGFCVILPSCQPDRLILLSLTNSQLEIIGCFQRFALISN